MNSLENQFHDKMLEIYYQVKKEVGYTAVRYLMKVRKDGGLNAARYWLTKKKTLTKGFLLLHDHGRLDLTFEALVISEPWKSLFSDEEIRIAQERLKKAGYSGPQVRQKITDYFCPEEINAPERFPEGTKRQICVNVYERSKPARDACIKHYGYKCYICGFSFQQVYGDLGKDFIHIHHLRLLSTIREDYSIDPIQDLRPVCPNCHAMIHQTDPPMSVGELKKILNAKNLPMKKVQ